MDFSKVESGAKSMLEGLGVDLENQHYKKTPERVAKMLVNEFCIGYTMKPEEILSTEFADDRYDEMVLCTGIDMVSMCRHHMLPFWGEVSIGYIPQGKVVGLSKLGRLVDVFSKRLQVQEDLAIDIVTAFQDIVRPRGCGVVIKAKHFCVCGRGVRKINSEAVTLALRGTFLEAEVKSEFLESCGLFKRR